MFKGLFGMLGIKSWLTLPYPRTMAEVLRAMVDALEDNVFHSVWEL